MSFSFEWITHTLPNASIRIRYNKRQIQICNDWNTELKFSIENKKLIQNKCKTKTKDKILIFFHSLLCQEHCFMQIFDFYLNFNKTFLVFHVPLTDKATGLKDMSKHRSSRPELFCKKSVLRRPATLLRKDSGTSVFLWILGNFYEHLFLQNTSNGCFWKQHFLSLSMTLPIHSEHY